MTDAAAPLAQVNARDPSWINTHTQTAVSSRRLEETQAGMELVTDEMDGGMCAPVLKMHRYARGRRIS